MRICVYCASSQECDPHYHEVAFKLGALLAAAGCTVVYGGGSAGSMGAVANGALSAGGEVVGILPKFMADLEWGHPGLTRLELVEDMRERKHRLLTGSDAVIARPLLRTLEELFEALTLKRPASISTRHPAQHARFYTPLQGQAAYRAALHEPRTPHDVVTRRRARRCVAHHPGNPALA